VLVVALCEGLQAFWVKRSRIKDGLYYLPRGIEAAQTIAQSTSTDASYQRLASLQQTYGQLLQHDGQMDEAGIQFEEALTLFNRMPDREGQYKTLVSLGEMAHHRGALKEAEQHYRQSLEILRYLQGELDGQEGGKKRILYQQHEGEILTFLGQIAQQRGRLREAEGYYKQSMETLQITGSYASQVHNYIHLGEIAQYRGQKEKAQRYYEDALAITRDEKDRHNEAWVLAHMSDLALTFKDMNIADLRCQEALTIAQEVQHRRCECWMLRCQGRLMRHRRLLSAVDTKTCYENALTMAQKIQNKWEESQIYVYLGDLAQERGQMKDARANYEKALEVASEIQDAVAYACIALKLGRLLVNQNPSVHLTEGRTRIKEAVQLYASMKLLEEREARYILAQYG
jgi:tetratricopeptide (TPR) repeat protein